jgi:hypothetical protein
MVGEDAGRQSWMVGKNDLEERQSGVVRVHTSTRIKRTEFCSSFFNLKMGRFHYKGKCIFIIFVSDGRRLWMGGKGRKRGQWGLGKRLNMRQLTLSMGPARAEVRSCCTKSLHSK